MTASEHLNLHDELMDMPNPGAINHLEYIANKDIPEDSLLWDPNHFLIMTNIATTFAKVIRRHPTFWPSKRRLYNELHTILDSETDIAAQDWPQQFSGSINIYPTIVLPDHESAIESETFNQLINMGVVSLDPGRWPSNIIVKKYSKSILAIKGRPNPGENSDCDYSYSLYLPLDDQLYYDPSPDRILEAKYEYPAGERAVFIRNHSMLGSDCQADPLIFHSAIKEASYDLSSLFHHIYGKSNSLPELKPADPSLVFWHPDYLSDDPNETLIAT